MQQRLVVVVLEEVVVVVRRTIVRGAPMAAPAPEAPLPVGGARAAGRALVPGLRSGPSARRRQRRALLRGPVLPRRLVRVGVARRRRRPSSPRRRRRRRPPLPCGRGLGGVACWRY